MNPTSEPSPDRSLYSLGFKSLYQEGGPVELEVVGDLPAWLTGALVRTGPSQFEVGDQRYQHWFDGLAMLHRFAFSDQRVSYSNRFLKSRSYQEAQRTGEITIGEFATDPCRSIFQRVAAFFSPRGPTDNCNVNVNCADIDAIAMTETRMPVRFDARTLETLGQCQIDERLTGPVSSAHPQIDRTRGLQYNYLVDFGYRSCYRLFATDLQTNQQTELASIPVERPAYMHSFGMSEHHLVLAEFPLVVNPLRFKLASRPFITNYRWEPQRGVRFHVIEKETGRAKTIATTRPFFAFHHVHAQDQDDDLLVDLVVYPDPEVIDHFYLDRLRSAETVRATGQLVRFRIGRGGEVQEEALNPEPIELPRMNRQHSENATYRFVYGVGVGKQGDFFDQIVKLDVAAGLSDVWRSRGVYPGEPVFVGDPAGDAEDDGVLLSVVLDADRKRSFLLILNAKDLREIARAEAPHPIPFGFHGQHFPW